MRRHIFDTLLAGCALVLTLILVLAFFGNIVGSLADMQLVQTMERPEEWAGYYRRAQVRLLIGSVGGLLIGLPGLWLFWSRFGSWLRRP